MGLFVSMARVAACLVGAVVVSSRCPIDWIADPMPVEIRKCLVGQVERQCCLPGRRWGCSPENFGQTGCIHIREGIPQCQAETKKTMKCTSAACQAGGPEDVCDLRVRMVGVNQCQPTGRITTVGCEPDHWQCQVEMTHYTSPNAPLRVALVCHLATSTICNFDYSACD